MFFEILLVLSLLDTNDVVFFFMDAQIIIGRKNSGKKDREHEKNGRSAL